MVVLLLLLLGGKHLLFTRTQYKKQMSSSSPVDTILHHEIAKNMVKLERSTFWENAVRVSWSIVLGYALFVAVCIFMASNARPSSS